MEQSSLNQLASAFCVDGRPGRITQLSTGLIHTTYIAEYHRNGLVLRYLHQRINTHVFGQPDGLMDNIHRITAHLQRKLEDNNRRCFSQQVLCLVPARDGKLLWRDDRGHYWRTYRYVENSRAFNTVDGTERAWKAAAAFGEFVRLLEDFPRPRLYETIPNFHNLSMRLQNLLQVVDTDPMNRAVEVKPQLDFILAREDQAGLLDEVRRGGELPERIVHNDTKLNNILFHATTGEILCVVDL
ncbi:MAG: phosphotransferase, partial [Gammaproteobacteria bacterium]|nr:phosphotransferase [Gammaproteobacteria bacterium]